MLMFDNYNIICKTKTTEYEGEQGKFAKLF